MPTFLAAAMKDPIGANLERYQIVKGWVDKNGKVQEKVHDVARSGDRKPGQDGKLHRGSSRRRVFTGVGRLQRCRWRAGQRCLADEAGAGSRRKRGKQP